MRRRNFDLKKKVYTACTVGIMAAAIVTNVGYVKAAVPGAIKSKGNLALYDGSSMGLYSADIQYLQEELNDLFDELPPLYHNKID